MAVLLGQPAQMVMVAPGVTEVGENLVLDSLRIALLLNQFGALPELQILYYLLEMAAVALHHGLPLPPLVVFLLAAASVVPEVAAAMAVAVAAVIQVVPEVAVAQGHLTTELTNLIYKPPGPELDK
jgi:hypothetical protein